MSRRGLGQREVSRDAGEDGQSGRVRQVPHLRRGDPSQLQPLQVERLHSVVEEVALEKRPIPSARSWSKRVQKCKTNLIAGVVELERVDGLALWDDDHGAPPVRRGHVLVDPDKSAFRLDFK